MGMLKALGEVAGETGPVSVALAWLLAQPTTLALIASATSVEQLGDLFRAVELQLTAEQVGRLTEASAYEAGASRDDSAFHFGGEIRPLLDTESAQVTNRDRKPWEGFEGVHRSEEVRQVLVVAGVNAALTPFEVEGGKEVPNLGVGLRETLRVSPPGVVRIQIEGNCEHYSASGSRRIASRG